LTTSRSHQDNLGVSSEPFSKFEPLLRPLPLLVCSIHETGLGSVDWFRNLTGGNRLARYAVYTAISGIKQKLDKAAFTLLSYEQCSTQNYVLAGSDYCMMFPEHFKLAMRYRNCLLEACQKSSVSGAYCKEKRCFGAKTLKIHTTRVQLGISMLPFSTNLMCFRGCLGSYFIRAAAESHLPAKLWWCAHQICGFNLVKQGRNTPAFKFECGI